jgi:GNAT superfamily N-acetyltransferase
MSLSPPVSVTPLGWDTSAFGFGVARAECAVLGADELAALTRRARELGVRLLYLCCPEPVSTELLQHAVQGGQLQAHFVEQRARFARRWEHSFLPSERFAAVLYPNGSLPLRAPESASPRPEVRLEAYPQGEPEPVLYELAQLAGNLSRFRLDPLFPPELFQMLYAKWIERSTRHEIASAVIVAKAEGHPIAFVSVGTRTETAAVSAHWRGRGIARALMSAAETVARASGRQALEVVTQGANTAARKLYERSGYTLEYSEWMYHLWL